MSLMKSRWIPFLLCLFVWTPVSRIEAAVRVFQYEEIKVLPQMQSPPAHVHTARPLRRSASTPVKWVVPDGWSEQKGQGMRLATFVIPGRPGQAGAECSVISLAAAAGGVSANVQRWMGQLGVTLPENDSLEDFLRRQTEFHTAAEEVGLLVDFSALLGEASAEAPSMVVGIIPQSGRTLFFKLTGARGLVQMQREALLGLCRSVK